MFAALLAVFVDLRGSAPVALAYALASTQFVPALLGFGTGAAFATALVVILIATLAVGRVYCSAICPLGILQDVIWRIRRLFARRRPLLRHEPARRWTRRGFFWATIAGMLTGWFGFTLSLIDPYSVFGRIASDLFRPIAAILNNGLAAIANATGSTLVNRVEPQWAAVGALAFPLLGLGVVAVLAWRRGRLYCNTVCPVGTLLGLISARSAFRLTLDAAACRKCGDCLRECKAQCIDLRSGTIDASRCVSCFNCLVACDRQLIGFRFSWKRSHLVPRTDASGAAPCRALPATTAPDPRRRAFVAELGRTFGSALGVTAIIGLARASEDGEGRDESSAHRHRHRRRGQGNESPVIAPPGAESIDRLLEHCTACHLCISACPTHVLQPAFLEYGLFGLMKPRMDYTRAYCVFDCNRCTMVCPDGALTPLDLARKHTAKIGVAKLDIERCIVKTKGTDCAACSEHCPTKAVDTKPYGDNLRLPWVHAESCIGCGACEFACPVEPKAIRVTGHRRHAIIRERPPEPPKPPLPSAADDFPF